MLKGKNGLIIAVVLNIAVWSFFAYRFYIAFHEGEDLEIENVRVPVVKTLNADTIEYKLSLNYDDPFLKKESHRSKAINLPKEQVKLVPKKVEKEPVKMPDIKYLGLVKNSSSGIATAIISVNGQSKIVKANESVEGIVIKSFDGNELVAYVGKVKLVIKK